METGSKALFRKLLSQFSVNFSPEEREVMAYWLLEYYLKLSKAAVHADQSIKTDWSLFVTAIDRINCDEPIQYVLQEAWFYGRRFHVTPSVLIPRPETELLIDEVKLFAHGRRDDWNILDIGTGSGCIAATLALELSNSHVSATEVDAAALQTARHNFDLLGAKVESIQHNILTDQLPWSNLDVVASNPPYVMRHESASMNRNVLGHEPSLALFVPDEDPLLFYRAIAGQASRSLRPGGLLLTEINESQGEATASLFASLQFTDVKIIPDLRGRQRFVSARWRP